MQIEIRQGDILTEPADILVCSANISLNLSGGVGGEILLRYGPAMQRVLHRYLEERHLKFVQPAEVVQTEGHGTPFRYVLHAVAVDGWYHTSAEVVANTLSKALHMAAELGARRVAAVALGTGFGRLSMKDFGAALRKVAANDHPPIETICVVVQNDDDAALLREMLGTEDGPRG